MDTNLLNKCEEMFQLLMDKVKVIYIEEQEWERKNNSYNIFQVLKIERKEVTLHSNFIFDLLNPEATHQKSSLFMKKFLERVLEFPKEKLENFDEDNYLFEREVYAGENGRIDFILYDKINKFAHIIEMKIDAYDQDKQLKRYDSFAKKIYGNNNYSLYYLTLDEKDASFESRRNVDDYTNITFKNNISTWLEDSLSQIETLSFNERNFQFETAVKEYLMTINKISSNIGSETFEEKYLECLTHKNIKDIEKLINKVEELKKETLDNLNENICQELQKKFPTLNLIIDKRLEEDYISIYITKLKDLSNISIGIVKEDSKLYFSIGVYDSEYKILNGYYKKYVEFFEKIDGLKRDIGDRIYYQYIYNFEDDECEVLGNETKFNNLKTEIIKALTEKLNFLVNYEEENNVD